VDDRRRHLAGCRVWSDSGRLVNETDAWKYADAVES